MEKHHGCDKLLLMSNVKLECTLSQMKRISQEDGLVRTELNVRRDSWDDVHAVYRRRLPVTVVTSNGKFAGGIRKRNDGMPYLCGNLRSEPDGTKISLTRLLKDIGIEPSQKVEVEVVDGKWYFPSYKSVLHPRGATPGLAR